MAAVIRRVHGLAVSGDEEFPDGGRDCATAGRPAGRGIGDTGEDLRLPGGCDRLNRR